MDEFGTYNFPDHTSGDTLKEKLFSFSSHPAYTIKKVELITDKGNKLSSSKGEILITDAVNWSFKIKKQIISWPPNLYKYSLRVFFDLDNKVYVKGTWNIT